MSKLNITDASKAVGVTRATIYKYINNGVLSAEESEKGKRIDVSELLRVFGEVKEQPHCNPEQQNIELKHENQLLKERLSSQIEIVKVKDEQLALIKKEYEKKEKQLLFLETQKEGQKSFWNRFFS